MINVKKSKTVFQVVSVLIALLFTKPAFASELQKEKSICILNFNPAKSRITEGLESIFKKARNVVRIDQAIPTDALKCLELGADEIIMVVHSMPADETMTVWKAAYYREITGLERETRIQSQLALLEREILKAKERAEKKRAELEKLPSHGKSPSETQWDDIVAYKLNTKKAEYESFPEDQPLYLVRPFLQRSQNIFVERVRELKTSGKLKVKKLRVLSCQGEKLAEFYTSWKQLESLGVQLDIAPQSKVLSWIYDRGVANLNRGWLLQSLAQ